MNFPSFSIPLPYRLLIVCALIVLLAIPTAFVWAIVELRSDYESDVTAEIAAGWGGALTLMGPFMHLDVHESSADATGSGTNESSNRSYFLMPKSIAISTQSTQQTRHIGIFKRPVYTANTSLVGHFEHDLHAFASSQGFDVSEIEGCTLLLTVSFAQAIRSMNGAFAETPLIFEPSSQMPGWQGETVQARLQPQDCAGGTLEIATEIRGSQSQAFALVGDESSLNLSSSWPHPKFHGRQLPDSHEIQDDGFRAEWQSNALARGFASELNERQWLALSNEHTVGFSYNEPVSLYRMVTRAVKYGFFVIGLTLLAVFCLELVAKVNFHPVQYAIVGAGLAIFYLLLLSLSEHIGFMAAFIVASISLTTLIVGYAWFSTKRLKFSASVAVLLIGIYGALYVCLSSTDYALLIGSLLLVILLTGLMYATRNMALPNAE